MFVTSISTFNLLTSPFLYGFIIKNTLYNLKQYITIHINIQYYLLTTESSSLLPMYRINYLCENKVETFLSLQLRLISYVHIIQRFHRAVFLWFCTFSWIFFSAWYKENLRSWTCISGLIFFKIHQRNIRSLYHRHTKHFFSMHIMIMSSNII